jgi:hypothetical protein
MNGITNNLETSTIDEQIADLVRTVFSGGKGEIRRAWSFMNLGKLMCARALPYDSVKFSDLNLEELTDLEGRLTQEKLGKQNSDLLKVRAELCRRDIGDVNALEVLQKIVRLCSKPPHGRTTHVRLFRALWPREAFEGRGEGSRIMKALKAVMVLCIENELPPLNLLVVNRTDRNPTRADVKWVYELAKRLGAEVGSDPDEYVTAEMEIAVDICWHSGG